MAEIHIVEQTTPSNPATGKLKVYADSVDNKLKQIDSSGVVKDLTDSASPSDNCRIGFWDYNDTTTASTPISITAATPTVLTNDGAGAFSLDTYKPIGLTDVWDDVDSFDWSELPLGTMVDIRLDVTLTTLSVNTTVEIDLHLGIGAGSYTIPFVTDADFKVAASHTVNKYNGIYIGDANTKNNGGQFKITCDKNSTVIVNGWYVKVLLRG